MSVEGNTVWSNTVEVRLECGGCGTTMTTRVITIAERAVLIRDFSEAHTACRISKAAREAEA